MINFLSKNDVQRIIKSLKILLLTVKASESCVGLT